MIIMKNIIPILFCLLLSQIPSVSAQTQDSVATASDTVVRQPWAHKLSRQEMIPRFTATVLGRYEYNTQQNLHHFELRHTRIGVSGDLHSMFSYMALVDLTYGGKFSPVAIFAKFKPVLQASQRVAGGNCALPQQ